MIKPFEQLSRGWQRHRTARANRVRLASLEMERPVICKVCKEPKERDDNFSSYIVRGVRRWHAICIRCRNTRYKHSETCAEKRALLDSLRERPCACGVQLPPRAMRFVCVRGHPAFSLSGSWTGRSKKAILEEANKYEVSCPNCVSVKGLVSAKRIRHTRSKLAELSPELRAQAGPISLLADQQVLAQVPTNAQ